jgi:hypothetical protein
VTRKFAGPHISVLIDLNHPDRSRAYISGLWPEPAIEIGSQVELRMGKVSHNEIVIRIPREDCVVKFKSSKPVIL